MAGVVLHRCRTPTDWLCPCGRVARELRRRGHAVTEVREPWRRRDRDDLERISGQRTLPVAVFPSGEAVCDSRRIVEHLEWLASEAAERP